MGQQPYPMYGPEHDACGIGAVVSIKGIKTHRTVDNALKIVEKLEIIVAKGGMEFLGWRDVPTSPEILGQRARDCMPCICQCFVNSIYSNLLRAYDNCITLREEIGTETVAYIQLTLYELQQAGRSPAPLIELQRVDDNILAFWGMADDSIDSENVRDLIKVGKRMEQLDLYARLRRPAAEIRREANRLAGRIPRTQLHYDPEKLQALVALAEADAPDHPALLRAVEAFLEGQV